jgi:hypothetical protein
MNNSHLIIFLHRPSEFSEQGRRTDIWKDWLSLQETRATVVKNFPQLEGIPESVLVLPLPESLTAASKFLAILQGFQYLKSTVLYTDSEPKICKLPPAKDKRLSPTPARTLRLVRFHGQRAKYTGKSLVNIDDFSRSLFLAPKR